MARSFKTEAPPRTLREMIDTACAHIAPAWPLDRAIAVNPYWGWVDRPITTAAASIGALHGGSMTMPRAYYRAQRDAGLLTSAAIARALAARSSTWSVSDVLAALDDDATTPIRFPLLTDVLDVAHSGRRAATAHEVMLDQIGRSAEAFFDAGEAAWRPDRSDGLFALWRSLARVDLSPRLELGIANLGDVIDALPPSPIDMIDRVLDAIPLPTALQETYLNALLHSVVGWASAAAFRRWDARQHGSDDDTIVELLAIRLAWDYAVFRGDGGTDLAMRWTRAWRHWQDEAAQLESAQDVDWILQLALEIRYHEQLGTALALQPPPQQFHTGAEALPTVRAQLVCCIDVRSERLRRALETVDPEVSTLGFAGFFGLPMQIDTATGERRAHLPGLLTPSLRARLSGDAVAAAADTARDTALASSQWSRFQRGATSTFAAVESTGLVSLLALLRDAVAPLDTTALPRTITRDALALEHVSDGTPLSIDERADLGAAILRAMSLTAGFARTVAFVGHGATVTNNPQAAALACGACGGESGELSARLLATLLNDYAVRDAIRQRGIDIPAATWFVAGVHDTVTDAMSFVNVEHAPASHREEMKTLIESCAMAAGRVRAERAGALGISAKSAQETRTAMQARAANWAEVRPEWALARNAVFIAAPRARTAAFDLRGRAFLHEYVWQRDAGFQVLTSILTAPVVVAHWINLQYYASVVDPERYGSGDKALHNIAAGNAGVYEGAGGDLRIGLARQSVHDGQELRHEPLRLAVYLEAPAIAIDQIIESTPIVRDLVANQWIHLYRIASDEPGVFVRRADCWERIEGTGPR